MTIQTAPRPPTVETRPPDGGAVARRAVVRWAWRLFRREWRGQAQVLGLLTLVVAATIVFSTGTYNTSGVGDEAEFGTAPHLFRIDDTDAATARAAVTAAEEWFGEVGVVATWERPVPGSVERVQYRAQDPDGPFSTSMLALQQGRFPRAADEVALTDGVATSFRADVGDTFDLDGRERTVVGMVENPSELAMEFALVSPADNEALESVTILVGGSLARYEAFPASAEFQSGEVTRTSRAKAINYLAAAATVGVAQLGLVLVALMAAASYAAVAQRRLQQLGMLASIGATQRHLRLVVVANGALLGFVAAILGGALGVLGWVAFAPLLESAVGYRIDAMHLPWGLVAATMVLAIVAATAAAWWPARTVARVSISDALSGRPQPPAPARQSARLAVLFVAIGMVCLTLSDRTSVFLLGTGAVALVVGVLLVSPLAIRLLTPAAGRLPIAVRLALRDLGRYQARSAAALAGISLSLGIPVALVISGSAAAHGATLGNVSDRQLVVWTRDKSQPEGVSPFFTVDPHDSGFAPYLPKLTVADLAQMSIAVDRMAAGLGDPRVTGLDVASTTFVEPSNGAQVAVTLARRTDLNGGGLLDVALVYVATPALLTHLGVDGESAPDAEVLSRESGELWIPQVESPPERIDVASIDQGYSSLPGSFVTPEALAQHGWDPVRVGWLLETEQPLTPDQIAAARQVAAKAGLLVETREAQRGLLAIRWQATGVGALVALCVLAMTVGLIRSAAGRDLRTLTATGATSGIRRTITAATAGALAFLGAALGIVGAYLGLAAAYRNDLNALIPLPVAQLAAIVVGVPVVAAAAAWLLSGREPVALSRQAID